MTVKLERWTGWLLVFLALGAFVLSFSGMYAVAVDAGYGRLAWLWPLVTESAVVIFSLILLTAKLDGYHNRYLHPMIVGCTSLSVLFNIWHAPSADLLTRAVVALPPLFLYAAFKTWIWKVEQDTRRAGLVTTLDTLTAELSTLDKQRDTKLAELDTLNAELDDIVAQVYRLKMDIQQDKQQFVTDNGADLSNARQVKQQQADSRKRQALAMWTEGVSQADIAATLEVTPRTVKRYLNGHGVTQ